MIRELVADFSVRATDRERLSERKGYEIYSLLDILTLPLYLPIRKLLFVCLGFFDVAGFFVCLVLIEYVVCSVLSELVQRFEPQVGCS